MIKTLNAIYTGGNIWLFLGQLNDGNYFATLDEGYTTFYDAEPDSHLYDDWCKTHKIKDLDGEDLENFQIELLNFLGSGNYEGSCMNDDEIDGYRDFWELEGKTYSEIETDYCPSSDTTYLMMHTYNANNKELIRREVVGFYSGEPDEKNTEAFKNNKTKAIYGM